MRLGFRIQSKTVRWLMPSTSAALHPRHVQLLKCMTFSLVLLRHNVTFRWNLAAISSCQLIMSSQHSHVTFTNLLFASRLTFMLFEMERNGMNLRVASGDPNHLSPDANDIVVSIRSLHAQIRRKSTSERNLFNSNEPYP